MEQCSFAAQRTGAAECFSRAKPTLSGQEIAFSAVTCASWLRLRTSFHCYYHEYCTLMGPLTDNALHVEL